MTAYLKSICACVATLLCVNAIADSEPGSDATKKPKIFKDEHVSFPIPDGATVKPIPTENTYLVFCGEEMWYLRLRGKSEPEDFGRQRTEVARKETLKRMGVPMKDGDSTTTITAITEARRHMAAKSPVYLFTFTGRSVSKAETGDAHCTIGFGSIGKHAVWFQYTSRELRPHPSKALSFLESVSFSDGAQPGTGQPATRPVVEPEGGEKPQSEAEGRSR
jgi:hypothetical protein